MACGGNEGNWQPSAEGAVASASQAADLRDCPASAPKVAAGLLVCILGDKGPILSRGGWAAGQRRAPVRTPPRMPTRPCIPVAKEARGPPCARGARGEQGACRTSPAPTEPALGPSRHRPPRRAASPPAPARDRSPSHNSTAPPSARLPRPPGFPAHAP